MSQIDALFERLRSQGRKALMPFLTAGHPSLEWTAAALTEFQARGCAMAEVGFPYSDPIADGPVIQDSYTKALAKGIKNQAIFDVVASFKNDNTAKSTSPKMPVVGMISYSIIYQMGLRQFVVAAQKHGFDGAIVPDLLVEEAAELRSICNEKDFGLIHLTTPTTPRERAIRIAESSTGFLYYVSVAGITGERRALPEELASNVAWLRQRTALPICIGFGISTPAHVATLSPFADGLIVGSAVVRRMAALEEKPTAEGIHELGDFVQSLVDATK
jgi:tryptophan synthase alpha chain